LALPAAVDLDRQAAASVLRAVAGLVHVMATSLAAKKRAASGPAANALLAIDRTRARGRQAS
jgi:hypothetical protein